MKSVTPRAGPPGRERRRRDGGAHLPVVAVRARQLAQDLECARVVGRRTPVEDLPTLELHVGGEEGQGGPPASRRSGRPPASRTGPPRRCCSGARSGPIPTGTDTALRMFVGGSPASTIGDSSPAAGVGLQRDPGHGAPPPTECLTGAGDCDDTMPMVTKTTRMSAARPTTIMAGRMEIPPGVGGRRGSGRAPSLPELGGSLSCSVMPRCQPTAARTTRNGRAGRAPRRAASRRPRPARAPRRPWPARSPRARRRPWARWAATAAESVQPVPWSLPVSTRSPGSTKTPSGPATTSSADSVRWPPFTTT